MQRYASLFRDSSLVLPKYLEYALELWDHAASLGMLRGVKKQANEVRTGNVLEVDGKLLEVVKAAHSMGHGRQLGSVQLELRNLKTRRKQNIRQRPYDMVEVVRLESRAMQLLFAEGKQVHLMDEHFEQITVDRDLFGTGNCWLSDGMDITLHVLQDGEPVTGEVPQNVMLKVVDGGAYTKGDTAGSSLKVCKLENGIEISVPPYVQTGQHVIVDTRDGSFVKRLS